MSLQKLWKKPVVMQSLQAGLLMASGDIVSQFGVEGKSLKTFDIVRPIRFFGIGLFVVGPTLSRWYGVLERRFGSQGKTGVFKKVCFDQLVFAPSFLVVFVSVVGLTQGKNINEISEQLKKDYVDVLTTNWMVWPAVQVCNFSVVPLQHQVLVVQCVALFWNTYLAWKTNKQ